MPAHRHREETVNMQLAMLISGLGSPADAETILASGKERPDVLFNLRGLRVAIEGKYNRADAREDVLKQARGRMERGIAHMAAAVVYPASLRIVPSSELAGKLETAKLAYCIITEYRVSEWFDGPASSLMDALRREQESLVEDNVVEETAKSLSERMNGVAQLWVGQPGTCDRLADILGMPAPRGETRDKAEERRIAVAKIAALVIANALIFQEQLSVAEGRVAPLSKVDPKSRDIIGQFREWWNWTWTHINYAPIFHLGERVLTELPMSSNTNHAFRALLEEAKSICERQTALRHDLMGRVYHWLLHEAKFLGAYYTSVSAATLLLKLAFAAPWNLDFGDPMKALVKFKIADLACGTGTLLMAAAQTMSDAFILTRSKDGRPLNPVDLNALHRCLMENIIHGYDVLPSAVHLTASTLAMLAPQVAFSRMNLYVMPLGMDRDVPRLGSLDFILERRVMTQFALDNTQAETVKTSVAREIITNAEVPDIDLCVMNPPFVRSVGGNLLFGSLPKERGKLQTELSKRVKNLRAKSTAGLGAVFIALADVYLRIGGRMAFVVPAALASGESWSDTRRLIADKYHLETVVMSHDAEHPNFSENTDLSEVLFIARKLEPKEKAGDTVYVNLWNNPRTAHEALDIAQHITEEKPVSVDGAGITSIRAYRGKLAEVVSAPAPKNGDNWTGGLFAQTELLRVHHHLQRGQLRVPGVKKPVPIKVCALSTLGCLGYDRRDIHDAFEVSVDDWSPYPAFWNHDARKVKTIAQKPNARLLARTKPAKGRPKKDADQIWEKSGRVLIVERLWPITHRVLAVGFEKPVIGNTWWALKEDLDERHRKSLLLWFNGSLALLLYFGHRVTTRSAWMQMKKPAWVSMPVPDVRSLSDDQLNSLAAAYDRLSTQDLQALAKLDKDPVRAAIDEALCEALGLPDLGNLRELIAREPGLTGKSIFKRVVHER